MMEEFKTLLSSSNQGEAQTGVLRELIKIADKRRKTFLGENVF